MAKKGSTQKAEKKAYDERLYGLQVELVKLQRHVIAQGERILVIVEGRDAAGKDGTIKRATEHLSPRETRVVALGKPSDREWSSWYFQRFVPHLPAAGEIVFFNRSWYNRAGVEHVMGFCTPADHREFLRVVPSFEQILVQGGLRLFKYYLDISKKEQKQRIAARRRDPLKQWKVSPIDEKAVSKWDEYSRARNEMFSATHVPAAPWTVVRSDDKRRGRLSFLADLLSRCDYAKKDDRVTVPDPEIVFPYDDSCLRNGLIAS